MLFGELLNQRSFTDARLTGNESDTPMSVDVGFVLSPAEKARVDPARASQPTHPWFGIESFPEDVSLARIRDLAEATLLRPEPDAQVRRLWRGAQVVTLPDAASLAFASGALGDLRGPFLWLAVALGLGEMALATGRRGDR